MNDDGTNGWAVEIWHWEQGIRISKGPNGSSITLDLLIGEDKDKALEYYANAKTADIFNETEDFDCEVIHRCFWCLLDVEETKKFLRRLLAMLESEG